MRCRLAAVAQQFTLVDRLLRMFDVQSRFKNLNELLHKYIEKNSVRFMKNRTENEIDR